MNSKKKDKRKQGFARLQEAIDRLVQSKTVVIIAHRLNTVVHADAIAVLDEGRLVEHGTHQELMKKEGLYRRMWDEQQSVRGYKFASKGIQGAFTAAKAGGASDIEQIRQKVSGWKVAGR